MRVSTTQVKVNDTIKVWDGVFTVVNVNRPSNAYRWTVEVVDANGISHIRRMNSAGSVIKL
jgi:hypothetical protein